MNEFKYEKVKDPKFFRDNRLDAHSDHVCYRNYEELMQGESSYRYSLNGLWKFSYAKNYISSIAGFERLEYNAKLWDDIRVPAHIQMEGYDKPQYANVQYPWEGREEINPGEIPVEFNPVASYVKYFEVPEALKGMPLYISFQGVESGFALWLNGQYVGYSEDSFTPSEFELTPFLTEGENKLAVQVFKWCASSWCEDQDFFRFSGIFREVYLYSIPKVHIYDLKIQTLLDDYYKNAELKMNLLNAGNGRIVASLRDKEEVIGTFSGSLNGAGQYSLPVEQPKLWNAEIPYLYQLYLEVYDEGGELQEVVRQQIGFRRFEMKNGIMCLNGKRIVFRGVNRHEFSSVSGRVVSLDELKKDIITMKQNNFNAIRTCHYPNDSRIYALCDEYGLYMIDETNLETHGSWDPFVRGVADRSVVLPDDKPQWNAMMLDRANSIYQRDKNHAAILLWSCGNESFSGKNIYDMANQFRSLDPTRLVHYEGEAQDRQFADLSDVESQMYTSVEGIKAYLLKDNSKPFILCEYTHAMGNSCGAMHKYTDLTVTEPKYQGGFIWDYIDQTIYKKNRYGEEFQAYGGDFDDRPCDYNFSANGIAYGGDRSVSPKMQEVKYNYQSISIEIEPEMVKISNRNLFADSSDFECIVTLDRQGKQLKRVIWNTDVEPESVCQLPLPVRMPSRDGEYTITISFVLKEDTLWAKAGHEVAFGQSVFRVKGAEINRVYKDSEKAALREAGEAIPESTGCPLDYTDIKLAVKKPFEVKHGWLNLGVKGENFDVIFSYNFGGLVSYRYGGKELLKATPKPNFWRAPIDNDCGSDMMNRLGQWKLASMYLTTHGAKGPNPRVEEKEDCVVVTYTYHMPTTPESLCELSYAVYGDGTVKTKLSYDPVKGLSSMPEFGVMFKLDADYDQLEWYGMGEGETYNDRDRGAKLSIYHNQVKDNIARYIVPQECGNKTGVRYAKITDRLGRGMMWAGDCMHFSALPYTPHEVENAMHPYELPPVHYTVVRAALEQMGVGGDNSWGATTHPEYCPDVTAKKEFTFWFKGI